MGRHGAWIGCLAVAGVLLLASGGCTSRIIKEGIGTVRGARGIYAPIQPAKGEASRNYLAAYSHFRLGDVRDGFGGNTPPELFVALPDRFASELADKELPTPPGGRTLIVRGRIVHYENSSIVGHVLGPLEEVVARMELVDEQTGEIKAQANLVGRTKESVNQGVGKKAEGLAKAIVSWIASMYPEPPENE